MNATIVAVDLAKSIFEIAAADADWRIAQRSRLPRSKFFGFFVQLEPCQVVMEACVHFWQGSAHFEGRVGIGLNAHDRPPFSSLAPKKLRRRHEEALIACHAVDDRPFLAP